MATRNGCRPQTDCERLDATRARRIAAGVIVCAATLAACSKDSTTRADASTPMNHDAGSADTTADGTDASVATLTVASPAFAQEGTIPSRHTCEGEDVSPPLTWTGAPSGTQSFALIMDDPDAPDPAAPQRTWVHWVIVDLPATVRGLAEGVAALPAPANVGYNDWPKAAYGGPCPPIGRHRYFIKVYAVDRMLGLQQPTKATLEAALAGHVLAMGELMGTYQKMADSGSDAHGDGSIID